MSRILITGGSGFIGTNLVDFYIARGDRVINLDRKRPRNADHTKFWHEVSVLDSVGLESAIREFAPDVVLHMAARTDLDGKSVDEYQENVQGLKNLLNAITTIPRLSRLILASSRLVCRIGYAPRDEFDYCPTTAYGKSKVQGEKIVREFSDLKCSWVIVRPTSIWGPWFDVPYLNFFTNIQRGVYLHPRGRKIKKSFGFVGNTVYEIDKLVSCDDALVHGKTLYLADYPPIEVREWAETIREEMGARAIRDVPPFALTTLAALGDVVKMLGVPQPPLTSFRLGNLLTEMVHDLDPLKSVCGKLPYSMEEGVRKTVEWMSRRAC